MAYEKNYSIYQFTFYNYPSQCRRKKYSFRRNIPLCINCLGDYHDSPPIRHAPPNIRLPVVEIDGTIIYIHSLQFGSNITVTLEDIDGNIIYNVITITEVNMSFLVTQDILNRAHSITIYIDAEKYSGEI